MKSFKLFSFLAIFIFTNVFCSINCESASSKKSDKKMEKSETGTPVSVRPQYEITVTQAEKELGIITIETFPEEAPKHAENFDSLVKIGFYDGTAFHRVIPGFMIQGGDPNTKNFPNERQRWGSGDPSQTRIPAEFNADKPNWTHKRGIMSAARTNDPNSATSQFFLMHKDSPHLDKQYSIYGQVLSGLEIVDIIANTPRGANDQPNETITMRIKRIN